MKIDLGIVVFSRRIVGEMSNNYRFAEFVGKCIHRHLNGDTGRVKLQAWQTEIAEKAGTRRSFYVDYPTGPEVRILTEPDRNHMPRTSVVFFDEGGCI